MDHAQSPGFRLETFSIGGLRSEGAEFESCGAGIEAADRGRKSAARMGTAAGYLLRISACLAIFAPVESKCRICLLVSIIIGYVGRTPARFFGGAYMSVILYWGLMGS